jgi:hypothetical protein
VVTGGVISVTLPMNIEGGSVIGTGTIVGNITNNGTISPGFSPGSLQVSGNAYLETNSSGYCLVPAHWFITI